jgi:4'-phosphopantetheinyl transferase
MEFMSKRIMIFIADAKQIDPSILQKQVAILSQSELERFHAFATDEIRNDFLLAHALKRKCLAHLLKVNSDQLNFEYSKQGKPKLVDIPERNIILDFNISHARDIAGCAISFDGDIGFDIEREGRTLPSEDWEQIFSKEEIIKINLALNQDQYFLNVWTAKEAYAKFLGEGLHIDFSKIIFQPSENENIPVFQLRGGDPIVLSYHSPELQAIVSVCVDASMPIFPEFYVTNFELGFWPITSFKQISARFATNGVRGFL